MADCDCQSASQELVKSADGLTIGRGTQFCLDGPIPDWNRGAAVLVTQPVPVLVRTLPAFAIETAAAATAAAGAIGLRTSFVDVERSAIQIPAI
jgi:hypothetical protein